ncbi:FAD-dependent oxidoreductase [Fulvimarina manganoxydans]|uniref:FAD-dependent oxidoreductase n=1 Tax=Fulvimarina manganoxydans TaxID=937218 RepID=UPI00235422F9|nr:NAD(P)/FAD-dependent oxidoreductase [Fulvimarina manganoxydans]
MTPQDGPVVIAGAGPVGLTLAVELHRRGLPFRIVDRGKGPTPPEESRALAILPTTLAVLKSSGVADRLLADGHPIRQMEMRFGPGRSVRLPLSDAPTDTPFILSLPQGRTERHLLAWLEERGVAIEWGVAVEDVSQTHRPKVRLSSGDMIDAHALAGCDGVRSTVREALGIPWSGEGYPGDFSLADVTLDPRPDPSTGIVDLGTDGGARALLPFGDGRARLIGTVSNPDDLVAHLEGVTDVGWTSRFHVAFRHAERMARGMVFLAGDAAHVHSPVGGRGMNLGIWDAAWLAFLLSEGRASEYEMRRLPSVRAILDQTRAMTDFVSSQPGWARAFLHYGLPLALHLPPVRRRLAARFLALDLPKPEWLDG